MDILDGKLKLNDYKAVFIKDKEGKIVAVSFPIEGFHDLIEDIEDYSYLDGLEQDPNDTIPHDEVVKKFELTPDDLKRIRKELGLTQAAFGEKIGYAAGSIRNMETGQQKISSRASLAIQLLKRA